MRLLVKYLKPFAWLIVCSLVLLFTQAICDLTLPNMMSDIVNVGIQQSGIDESVPNKMSQNAMTLLTTFMKEEDAQTFQNAYTQNGEVYSLKEGAESEELANLYGLSCYTFLNFIQEMGAQNGAQVGTSEEGLQNVDPQQLYDTLLPMLSNLPQSVLDEAIEKTAQSDSMLYTQIGTTFTKLFYQELGENLESIQRNYILWTGGKMLLVALLGVLAAIAVGYISSYVGSHVSGRMRHDVFSKVQSFSNAEYEQFSTASLITRTTNDVQQVQMLTIMGMRMMCYAPIMGIGGVIMALNKSVSMSWIIAAAVLVLIGIIWIIFTIAMPKFKMLQKLIDKLNLVSRENLSGMMVIRAFGNQKHEEDRFENANRNLAFTQRFTNRVLSLMMPVMTLLMNVVMLAIVWWGGHAIANSTMQVGDMMAFMQYAMQIIMSFLLISVMFIMVPRAAVSLGRVNEVLDTELTIQDKKDPVIMEPLPQRTEVVFDDVSFRYPHAEHDCLSHISFVARPGETTAFIGATGAGKSTLVYLLPRFYDVTSGRITVNGVDVRDMNQKNLREMIGFVPQKGVLFSGDIVSNLQYGKENATQSEMETALEVAQASDFVSSMEEGIHSAISQGGDNVSGGQRQRLSIARALVKQAPIYVFDDSFSALDFKTDAKLRQALAGYTKDATVLIVAQRVSTIMDADQIIVLDEGKMVGKGTHKELLQSCDTYREIASSQLSKEELE